MAIACYRDTLRLQPNHVQAHLGLGRLLLWHDRVAEALQVFQDGLEFHPNQAEFHKGLVHALVDLGRVAAAFAYYGLVRHDTRALEIDNREILGCIVARNEAPRLPFLLEYYRRLGVNRFLVVDNDSTDGTLEFLLAQPDVHIWSSSFSFKRANFGSAWFEVLLSAYGLGNWCVVVDADELLVYPRCEILALPSLVSRVGPPRKTCAHRGASRHVFGSSGEGHALHAGAKISWNCAPISTGKDVTRRSKMRGPTATRPVILEARRRALGGAEYCLNKVPLIRYDREVILTGGQHWTNLPASQIASEVGALLHFKFFSSFPDYVADQVRRGEHYDKAIQYRGYAQALAENQALTLFDPNCSVRYTGSQQLVDLGIMKVGEGGMTSPHCLRQFPRLTPITASVPKPTWSVLLTVYDRVPFLEQALRSVLVQAAGRDEMQIQVVQDGSDPAVGAAVRTILDRMEPGRVEFHCAGGHLGQPEIFNRCIERAQGRLDSSSARRRLGGTRILSRTRARFRRRGKAGGRVLPAGVHGWPGFTAPSLGTGV